MKLRVGVVGYRGYSGAELLRILARHPSVDTIALDHREGEPALARYLDRKEEVWRAPLDGEVVAREQLSVVFLATPHDVSTELAPKLLEAGAKVIDLSGAFRLRLPENHRRWYREDHPDPALLATAVYGLPEFNREQIQAANLIANPGCYPTAASLAIRPLVAHDLIERNAGIVCDAKSGVSGAGRKPSLSTSFCEVTEDFAAYAVLEHRHVPEVLMNTGLREEEFSFTAQLLPINRGILETIYFRASRNTSASVLSDLYVRCYANEIFIRIHQPGSFPHLRDVERTNYCDLAIHFDESTRRGVIISAIDNLGKGAAGQAVQNMNLLLGFPETEALV